MSEGNYRDLGIGIVLRGGAVPALEESVAYRLRSWWDAAAGDDATEEDVEVSEGPTYCNCV